MRRDESLENLAKQASKGDEESFVELCDTLKVQLFLTAKGILCDEALALDAVSEAVYRAYKGIKRLREPKYVGTWFTRILLNVANDMYKRQKGETSVDMALEITYLDDYSDMGFAELIESLPLELREIISLKYYSDFTLTEIASILKIPEGTVKSRLNRALKQLRMEALNE